jgi:hypothetical protein
MIRPKMLEIRHKRNSKELGKTPQTKYREMVPNFEGLSYA